MPRPQTKPKTRSAGGGQFEKGRSLAPPRGQDLCPVSEIQSPARPTSGCPSLQIAPLLTAPARQMDEDATQKTQPLLGDVELDVPPPKACSFKPKKKVAVDLKDLHTPDKQSVLASLATLVLTLPALMGTCCWPVLLAGLIGISATAGAKEVSHTFSFALTLAILTNLAQFMAHKAGAKRSDLTHWQRYGPTYVLLAAIPLVLADQVRHCLQDSGIWPEPGSSMYRDDCESTGFFSCLTPIGWLFAICFTYAGFALLVVSVVWSTNLPSKISRAWSSISQKQDDYDCGCDA